MNMDVNGCTTTRRLTGTTLKQVGIIPCMATQKRCKEEFAIHSDEDLLITLLSFLGHIS